MRPNVFGARNAFAKNDLRWSSDLTATAGTIEGRSRSTSSSPHREGRTSGSPIPGVCAVLRLRYVSPFERGSNLSGSILLAQRSTVTRFQSRLPLTCASGSGRSSRRRYRHTLRHTLGRLTGDPLEALGALVEGREARLPAASVQGLPADLEGRDYRVERGRMCCILLCLPLPRANARGGRGSSRACLSLPCNASRARTRGQAPLPLSSVVSLSMPPILRRPSAERTGIPLLSGG